MRAFVRLLLSLMLIWLAAGSGGLLAAPDVTVFGPKVYARTTAAPNTYTESFSLPAGVVAPYLLRIDNGLPDGSARVSSATVTVNGVQVAGPNDFNQQVALIERPVALTPNNTLEVRLAGAPGGRLGITLLGTWPATVPVSLVPNPLALMEGASGQVTVNLAPAPRVAGTLTLVSSQPGIASVPASTGFGPGQTAVNVTVAGVAPGTAALTASANGVEASGTVKVSAKPPTVTQLLPNSLPLSQGSTGQLELTLSAAQANDVTVRLESTAPTVAIVPGSVVIPAGRTTALVKVATGAAGLAQVQASLNGSQVASQITVSAAPPTVVSLTPVTATVALGASMPLELTISAAQATPTEVSLAATPEGILGLPGKVVIPAGQTRLPISTQSLALGTASIVAGLNGGSVAAALRVAPSVPAELTARPSPLVLAKAATGTLIVALNAAQATNTEVALQLGDPALAQIPALVTIPAGQTETAVAVTALATGETVLTATVRGASQTVALRVVDSAPTPQALTPAQMALQQGATGTLSLTIDAAQGNDLAVPLANSDQTVIDLPAQAVVPAGRTMVGIPVTARTSGAATVTVGGALSASVNVTLDEPQVGGVEPVQLALAKGMPGRIAVTLDRAPRSPFVLPVVSGNPLVVDVPASVVFPAGVQRSDFPLLARGEGQGTVTVGGAVVAVTVTAPDVAALTLSPQTPTAYVGESLAFTLQGTYTDASQQDVTGQGTWTSSDVAVAPVASTGVASALATGSTKITAAFGNLTAVTTLNVELVPTLALSPASAMLRVDNSLTLTLTSSVAADKDGLPVALAFSGTGSVSGPATVVIPAGQSSATFVVTGLTVGDVTVSTTAPRRVSTSAHLTVVPKIVIGGVTPASGPVGAPVTISGQNFDPNPAGNDVRFNGERAIVAAATAGELKVIVPVRATSGPVTVTSAQGTATSPQPFIVQLQQDFAVTLLPAAVQAPVGGFASVRVRLDSKGLVPYAYAAAISFPDLPAGMTVGVERPTITANGESTVLLKVPAGTAAGVYNVTVAATGQTEIGAVTRSQTLALEVLPPNATTVTGRVLHTEDDSPFVGARIRLGGRETFTDASGYYRLVDPPVLGDQVLLVDGHTQATALVEYPSAIAMPVLIEAGKDNRALTSYIQGIDTAKFAAITPGVETAVTVPEIPNYSLNIPQGAILTGWDGTPVTKINVRTVPADRLPIKPLPPGVEANTVYLYYFFREGGANPTQPIPVTMANDQGALPGDKVELWYYDESISPDPNSNQWKVMGLGTVSADGKSIVSDPGVGIPKFCCGASTARNNPGTGETGANGGDADGGDEEDGSEPDDSPCSSEPGAPQTNEPVDLSSGNNLAFQMRRFGIASLLPVNLSCRYRSTDARIGAFGRGTTFAYEWFAEPAGSTAVRVTTPQGVRYLLALGTDGVFRASEGRQRAQGWEVRATATGRTLRFKRGREMDFDATGRLQTIRDPDGNRIQFTRDSSGFVRTVTDPNGRGYVFDITSVTINRVIYTLVSKITDALGRSQGFTYDAQARMSSHTDAGGGVTRYEYDAAGRISRKIEPRGGVMTFSYDSFGRTTKEVLQDGTSSLRYEYNPIDLDGLLVRQGDTTTPSLTRQVTASRAIDPNGHVTDYRFNGQGYVTRMTDALGRTTTYTRDFARNHVTAATDPAGRTVSYSHDAAGNVTALRDPLGHETQFAYAPGINKVSQITNALGHVTSFQYDAKGRLLTATNAEGQSVKYTWTPRGQVASIADPLGNVTGYTYDGEGNLVMATDPLGQTIRRSFDDANRLVEAVDALGNSSQRAYDALNRVTQVTDALGGLTRFAYDADDHLLTVTDPRGNVVESNAYDLRGRLTSRTDAAGLATTFQYDAAGNLLEATDRKGFTTRFSYDALNRVTLVQDADGRTTAYEYDLAGNVAAIRDNRSGDLLFAYDALDRPLRIVADQGTVEYAYDALGRRTQRTVNGAEPVAYAYDKVGRLTRIDFRGKSTTYAWDVAGRLAAKTLPNGLTQAYSYDAASRLTAITATRSDGSLLETVSYTYDAGGRRTARDATVAGVPETPIDAVYDNSNRLVSLTLGGAAYALSYDATGNLTAKTAANGASTAYTWDAKNRLSRIDGPAGSASFQYDALGRRIGKTVNGDTVQYLYDGAQAIAELRGGAVAATLLTGLAIDEVIARYTSAGERSLLTDALGSVLVAAQEDGQVVTAYGYSPYGEVQVLGSDEANPVQYTARENDGTGLYYYRARYYDPQLKRFISEDPIGLAGGLNTYSYVGGDPIGLSDPSGLRGFDAIKRLIKELIGKLGSTDEVVEDALGSGATAGMEGMGQAFGRQICEKPNPRQTDGDQCSERCLSAVTRDQSLWGSDALGTCLKACMDEIDKIRKQKK